VGSGRKQNAAGFQVDIVLLFPAVSKNNLGLVSNLATSSAIEWRGNCTAITLCPAFYRMEITLLHEDPSTQVPWTRTIFTFVAFVVATLCVP
jgi:hypothetical protein